MKVKFAEDTTLQAVGVRGTSSFNIATTAHMFHILSSGLYSDKVGAVLRELGCNAMDAHLMSGQPQRPFEVKLPTALDPTFYIKDWGPGLDHTEVTELYTTYGMSTKQHSDDATGAFGLGSKSPFAYADMFSIVAVKDGVQRIYTAHKENNAPVISLQSEAPASPEWPHGVMVTLPVAPADAAEFRTKAIAVYRWFETLPRVLGLATDELEHARAKFRFRGPGYALGLLDEPVRTAHVVMGNVAYPVEPTRIDKLDALHVLLLRAGIHLWLPVGAVMPTPSRESLQYDKDGQAALRAALDAAVRDVARGIVQRIRALKGCAWEWARQVQAYLLELPAELRYNIMSFVRSEVSEPSELAHIERVTKDTHLALPDWAGSEVAKRPADADPSAPGRRELALWWLNASAEGGVPRIARREVVRGGYFKRGEHEPVKLAYTAPLTVYYVDGPYGIERVRQALRQALQGARTGAEVNALVVVAASGAARAYAERLAGPHGCDLSEGPRGTSTLSGDDIAKARRRNKQVRTDPRVSHAAERVEYIDLRACTGSAQPQRKPVPLADVPPEDLAYVVLNTRARSWRQPSVFTTFADGSRSGFRASDLQVCLRAVGQLQAVLGDAWNGPRGVLVVSGAQVKQLELAAAGFRPMGVALGEAFGTKTVLEALAARIERYPRLEHLPAPTRYTTGTCGLAGLFAGAIHHGTPLGTMLLAQFGDNRVVQDALQLVRRFRAVKDGSTQGPDVRSLLRTAAPVLPALESQLAVRVKALDEADLRRRAVKWYPLVQLLDLDAIADGKHPVEEVATLLRCVFSHPAPSHAETSSDAECPSAAQALAA
jgi:hypothetical protein